MVDPVAEPRLVPVEAPAGNAVGKTGYGRSNGRSHNHTANHTDNQADNRTNGRADDPTAKRAAKQGAKEAAEKAAEQAAEKAGGQAAEKAEEQAGGHAEEQVEAQGAEPTPDHQGYERFLPLFVELAACAPGDPRHQQLRNQLVEEHLPVAQHIARRFTRRGEPLADLEQVATVGLINAVDRYEPDRGVDFLSFAVPTITGEVRRYFRDHGWAIRVPRRLKELHVTLGAAVAELSQRLGRAPTARELAAHLDIPFEDVVEGLGASNAYRSRSLDSMTDEESGSHQAAGVLGQLDAELEQTEHREALAPLLAELPERERAIIILRFFGNLTQTQIAERIGISQMHVSRLLSQTLATLREKLNAG